MRAFIVPSIGASLSGETRVDHDFDHFVKALVAQLQRSFRLVQTHLVRDEL